MIFEPILQIKHIFVFSLFFIISMLISYYYNIKNLNLRVFTFLFLLVFMLNPKIDKEQAEFHKDLVIVVSDFTDSIIES